VGSAKHAKDAKSLEMAEQPCFVAQQGVQPRALTGRGDCQVAHRNKTQNSGDSAAAAFSQQDDELGEVTMFKSWLNFLIVL